MGFRGNLHRVDAAPDAHRPVWYGGGMDRPFSYLLVSAFYDGPEEGVAFRRDGSALAFYSLGDSPLSIFRAFYFRPLPNCEDIRRLQMVRDALDQGTRMDFLDEQNGEAFDRCLAGAQAPALIGLGHPYLDWLKFAPATQSDVDGFLAAPGRSYRLAHAHLKRAT